MRRSPWIKWVALGTLLVAVGVTTSLVIDLVGTGREVIWLAPPRDGIVLTTSQRRRLWRWAGRGGKLRPVSASDPQLSLALDDLEPAQRLSPRERRLIRVIGRARRAVVALAGATGVNLKRWGLVLTAWHVVQPMRDVPIPVMFSTGRRVLGWVVAGSVSHDLALVLLERGGRYPVARLARREPRPGEVAVAVGNPRQETGQRPFHVSLGRIQSYGPREGLRGDVTHTAWTYWGHSGGPIFNEDGEVVAIHNSVDLGKHTRHGLRLDSVRRFLAEAARRYAQARLGAR